MAEPLKITISVRGRHYVNDLADVSKMRLRVAGYPRDRFVITTVRASSGDYDLPNDVQTNNENEVCWSSDLSYTTTGS